METLPPDWKNRVQDELFVMAVIPPLKYTGGLVHIRCSKNIVQVVLDFKLVLKMCVALAKRHLQTRSRGIIALYNGTCRAELYTTSIQHT